MLRKKAASVFAALSTLATLYPLVISSVSVDLSLDEIKVRVTLQSQHPTRAEILERVEIIERKLP
jgi:hypothetical protein